MILPFPSFPIEILTLLQEWGQGAVDRLLVAWLALVGAWALGLVGLFLRSAPQSFLWNVMDGCIGGVIRRLDRVRRARADRVVRGVIVAVITITFLWLCVSIIPAAFGVKGFVWEGIILTLGLAPVSALTPLAIKPSGIAHKTLERSTGLDWSGLEEEGIRRETLILACDRLVDSVMAPLVFFTLCGLEGLVGVIALSWCVHRLDPGPAGNDMGLIVRGLDRGLLAPVRILMGVILGLASACVPGARGGMRAFGQGIGGYRATLPLATMISALGVSVGGPVRRLDGTRAERPWWGAANASARLSAAHTARAAVMMAIALALITLGLTLGVLTVHGGSMPITMDLISFLNRG